MRRRIVVHVSAAVPGRETWWANWGQLRACELQWASRQCRPSGSVRDLRCHCSHPVSPRCLRIMKAPKELHQGPPGTRRSTAIPGFMYSFDHRQHTHLARCASSAAPAGRRRHETGKQRGGEPIRVPLRWCPVARASPPQRWRLSGYFMLPRCTRYCSGITFVDNLPLSVVTWTTKYSK